MAAELDAHLDEIEVVEVPQRWETLLMGVWWPPA